MAPEAPPQIVFGYFGQRGGGYLTCKGPLKRLNTRRPARFQEHHETCILGGSGICATAQRLPRFRRGTTGAARGIELRNPPRTRHQHADHLANPLASCIDGKLPFARAPDWNGMGSHLPANAKLCSKQRHAHRCMQFIGGATLSMCTGPLDRARGNAWRWTKGMGNSFGTGAGLRCIGGGKSLRTQNPGVWTAT